MKKLTTTFLRTNSRNRPMSPAMAMGPYFCYGLLLLTQNALDPPRLHLPMDALFHRQLSSIAACVLTCLKHDRGEVFDDRCVFDKCFSGD